MAPCDLDCIRGMKSSSFIHLTHVYSNGFYFNKLSWKPRDPTRTHTTGGRFNEKNNIGAPCAHHQSFAQFSLAQRSGREKTRSLRKKSSLRTNTKAIAPLSSTCEKMATMRANDRAWSEHKMGRAGPRRPSLCLGIWLKSCCCCCCCCWYKLMWWGWWCLVIP